MVHVLLMIAAYTVLIPFALLVGVRGWWWIPVLLIPQILGLASVILTYHRTRSRT